jgi:hypothetical protein
MHPVQDQEGIDSITSQEYRRIEHAQLIAQFADSTSAKPSAAHKPSALVFALLTTVVVLAMAILG